MTPEHRRAEFDLIWQRMPGRNIDKLRSIATICGVRENTVRIWRIMRDMPTHRTIPAGRLGLLKREVLR